MNFFAVVCLSALVVATNAAPQRAEKPIAIVKQSSNHEADGSYQYSFEAENGIKAQETGSLKRANSPDKTDVIVSQGSYSYVSPEGKGELIQVTYVADDEGGFQPQGAHLPTPPPIPAAIQRALDYILSIPESQRQK